MRVPLYVVDAFTETLFRGNPAAVVLFDAYPNDRLLQQIAAENNLAETAYPVRHDDGTWNYGGSPRRSKCRCAVMPPLPVPMLC
jgi:PhzF family phenazine biosynthesis protein